MSAGRDGGRPRPPWWAVAVAVIGTAAGVAFLFLRDDGPLALQLLTKPAPVLGLALWVGLRGRRPLRGLVLAGLLASVAGDLVLLGDGGGFFVGGLVCFLSAHLLYIAGFTADVRRLRPLRAVPFLFFTGAVFAVLLPGLGSMLGPVAVYCLAIAVMGWRAAARVGDARGPSWITWVGVAGATLFMLSDSLIALDRFLTPIPGAGLAIMVTYYLGQLGIAWSATEGRPGDAADG